MPVLNTATQIARRKKIEVAAGDEQTDELTQTRKTITRTTQ